MAYKTDLLANKPWYLLPLMSGGLPLLAIHGAFLVAAFAGHTDWCFPYLQNCTSISAIGREPPQEFVFKGLLAPGLIIMLWYWRQCQRWLTSLEFAPGQIKVISFLGYCGAILLLIYVVSLGESGEVYKVLRRAGVNLGAGLTYMAQLLLYRLLYRHKNLRTLMLNSLLWLLFSVQMWVILVIGVANLICKAILPINLYDQYLENPFEWHIIMWLLLHYLIIARAWHRQYVSK